MALGNVHRLSIVPLGICQLRSAGYQPPSCLATFSCQFTAALRKIGSEVESAWPNAAGVPVLNTRYGVCRMRGRSKRPQRRLGFLVLALVALEATAQSQPVVRQVLHGHVPAAVAKLPPLESLAATQRMRLAIALPLRSRPQLDHLLGDLYDPASPRFHQYLTASQFADTFGPSEQDYAEIAAFAQAHHLTVIGSHPNRTLLDVEGSVAAIEAAFHLELH